MNSKQRVLATINHQEPDRLPLDMWALPPVMEKLRVHFDVDDDEGVWQALGIDIRSVWPKYIGPPLATFDDGSYMDWWGSRMEMVGPFDHVVEPPLANVETPADVEAHRWPEFDWFDYAGMRPICEALGSEYALVIRDPGPYATCVLRVAMFMRGMEQFMMDMALNPDLAHAIIKQIETFYLGFNKRILDSVGDLTDIYFIADDVGAQNSLLISRKMFSEFIAPSLKAFMDQGKEYNQAVMYHCDGAIREMIPEFIEMGIDILNPIQLSAANMDALALKQEFGDAVCMHGALDIITVLSDGAPDQISNEVERLFKIMGPGGGFILSPTNNIMPETPVENVLAMYETAKAVGTYR